MYKLTLAVAALLGVMDIQAIQIEQKAQLDMKEVEMDQILNQEAEAQDHNEQTADFEQLSQDNQELVETQLDEHLSSSCSAGIKRWDSAANSLKAWQKAEKGKSVFKDKQFAGKSALYPSTPIGRMKDTVKKWKRWGGYGWQRPSLTYQNKKYNKGKAPLLWGKYGKPRPEGINQKALSDCWFLSAASAVAEEGDRITRLFANTEYSKNGAFRIYFWVWNRWIGINIDDRLPTKWGNYHSVVFTRPSKDGLAWWMPLMEKAYAKLNQDYQRIAWGNGLEGLKTLTGMPTTSINFHSSPSTYQLNALWKLVKPLSDKNFPMTISCCFSKKAYGGLYSSHAYTLLNLVELSNGQKLVQIRNPYSRERYHGDWSDGDKRWTSAYKKQAGYTAKKSDGLFFMPWDKFASNFRKISVSLYQQYGGFASSYKSQNVKKGYYYINNPKEQEMYVNIESFNERHVPRNCNLDAVFSSRLYYPGSRWYRVQDKPNDANQPYSKYLGWTFNGKLAKVPAGDYKLIVWKWGSTAKFSINVYWKDIQGKIY